ncbi:hypothetical protein JD969_10520 [Planctomycetota bacterium]|nr:hypothetical protein JD969_10520 [Planctomycetota bacterium]
MNINKHILSCAFAAFIFTTTSHAAIVIPHPDSINHPNTVLGFTDINVAGITYTASFVSGGSFNDIWDPNADGDFSDSTTGAPPTFWTSNTNASDAATVIFNTLSDTFVILDESNNSDLFLVPFINTNNSNQLLAFGDTNTNPGIDALVTTSPLNKNASVHPFFAWVIFTPIPEPTSLALLTLTTLPLFSRKIRRKHIA